MRNNFSLRAQKLLPFACGFTRGVERRCVPENVVWAGVQEATNIAHAVAAKSSAREPAHRFGEIILMKAIQRVRAYLVCVLAVLLVVPGAASAYTLSFVPSAQAVGLGGLASVAVRISGVTPQLPGSPGGLGDYDFEVVFDPAIVAFDSATDAGALGLAVGLDVALLAPGRLNLSAFSLEDPADLLAIQSDSMLLLTLAFSGIGLGISPLDFDNITVGDVLGTSRPATANSGSITVVAAPLPEPGTLALLVGAGLIVFGRRCCGK